MAASSANASVESMATPRDGDRNCTNAQENNNFALWRPSDGRLVIGGEGKAKFEFYGHGIDLSPDAQLTGISGASARRVDARGGAVNGARGCGNIGSVIVEIDLPGVGSANNGTLRIGSETIAFTATPRVAQNVEWDDANKADGRASGGTTAVSTAPPPPPPPTSKNGGGTCTGPGCPGPANSVQAPTSSGSTVTQPDTRTLPRCADAYGMKGEISNVGRDLTLTLPIIRTGAIEQCYGRHLLTRFVTKGVNDATTLSGPAPALGMTAPPALHASFRQQDGLKDKAGLITLDDDVLKTFVGRQSFDIEITPGSGSRLKLILKSEPAYGPKAIAAPLINPNMGRMSSDMVLKVTTYQAAGTGETFSWRLTPNDGAPGNCFVQTSGTATATSGATAFELPLRATEAANCSGKSFRATIATASVASPAGTPFEQSVSFVLQPLATVRVPNQNTPQVTRPSF
ncbi:hypothetical protein [Asticcacaulis sp. BE141]|nr:hypothetical protein [Asticcacaulis sp. BE141]